MAESLTPSWRDVDGWLTEEEGMVLQSLAIGRRVLELGTWKGRSCVCMAAVARWVTTVDHHMGDRNTGPGGTLPEFLANLDRHGVEPRVGACICTVAEFDTESGEPDFDMAFVDVEHTYEATLEALLVARRRVRSGGTIAWHDADYPEVRLAVAAAGLAPIASAGKLEWGVNG